MKTKSSVTVACLLPGQAEDLSAPLYTWNNKIYIKRSLDIKTWFFFHHILYLQYCLVLIKSNDSHSRCDKTRADRHAQVSDFNENWIAFTEFVKTPKTLSKLMVKIMREFPLKHIFVKAKFWPRNKEQPRHKTSNN